MKSEITNRVAAKAAVQAAAPAVLLACLACLLGAKRLDVEDETSLTAIVPAVCWRTIAGYLGWWVSACWGFFLTVGVALGRRGVAPFAP
jgi:hypothetical protein